MNVVEKSLLYDLYINEKMPMRRVAKELNIAVGTVYNYLKKYEIPTRKTGEHMKDFKMSEKHKQRIIAAHKGKSIPIEVRQKISEAHKIHGIGHKKKRTDGYIAVYYPEHPKSTKEGYIMEHVLIVEKSIGRHLKDNECVHHINAIRNDNKLENLKLMTKSEHAAYHSTKRWAEKKGGMTY